MRKLALDLDDLQVDSFQTNALSAATGTVCGQATAPGETCIYPSPDPVARRTDPRYELSCDISCVYGSCDPMCNTGYKCSDYICRDPNEPTG